MMVPQKLETIRITNRNFPEIAALQQLYEEAFPIHERRDFEHLLQLLDQPNMHFYVAKVSDTIVGLYVYWLLEYFCFLEHIAIAPRLRGEGFGRQLMQRILQENDAKLVLEVERPTDDVSQKRISFYQALGFTLHADFDYYQPPYRKGQQPVPMYLMAAPPLKDAAEMTYIASIMKQQVYERFYA